ncbi:MAG: aspartate-semialdehyde dehydrogenase [Firmicutes bacterium]|nr:aspartate-semialdehyde dehydrogenase [Bacillota bacterium]
MKTYNVAVLGATGLVGGEMIKILEEKNFPVKSLRLFATSRSAGVVMKALGQDITVEDIQTADLTGIEAALFAGGEIASEDFAGRFVDAGAVVVDNSAAFRMKPEVPLVVPEVNPEDLRKHNGIIANPNCSTIQMVVALKPIYDKAGIERVVVSTYQSVSGTGKAAVEELNEQSKAALENKEIKGNVYPHQIAFNLLPHIGSFQDNGYSSEELKMTFETRKILGDDSIRLSATTVRVPVVTSHSEAVNVETKTKITAGEVRELLSTFPGVTLMDDPKNNIYPYPVLAAHKDDVFVGRIREDISCDKGIEMFVVSDNLRKGAALNAVQILEKMIEMELI